MFPVTRFYESEQAAQEAVDALVAAGISPGAIVSIHPSSPSAGDSVEEAISNGYAASAHRKAMNKALDNGRSIVTALPGAGWGSLVESTMNRAGAVDTDTLPDYTPRDPSPFSDALGIPVLVSDSTPNARLSTFKKNSSFGFKLLSNNPTPFSSMFGMKVLKSGQGSIAKGSSVERMSGNAAPLSSMLGLKLLSGKSGKAKGSSVESMSDNPAPFSSFFSLRVLSKRD